VEVILLEDVNGLGTRGAAVKVKNGYARNFLLPRKLAIVAAGKTTNLFKTLSKQRETRDAKLRQESEALAARLEGVRVVIPARVSEEGLLFGSVTASDVSEALEKKGYPVDKRQVHLEEHIKQVGEHAVSVRLFGGVVATVQVEVVAQ
jgi:large subunit ribosomal protein L9